MAYEHDTITGRGAPEREARMHTEIRTDRSAATPWIVAAAVIVALVALIWMFGGTANKQPVNAGGGAPATSGEVAPQGATPGAVPPAAETAPATDPAPAPVAPLD